MLHGICYAFFFATVYIFVDEFFPKDARASAQGLFNLMILGFGPLVANFVGPKLIEKTFNHGGIVDFRSLFLVACGLSLLGAIALRSSSTRRQSARRWPSTGRTSKAGLASRSPLRTGSGAMGLGTGDSGFGKQMIAARSHSSRHP